MKIEEHGDFKRYPSRGPVPWKDRLSKNKLLLYILIIKWIAQSEIFSYIKRDCQNIIKR